MGHGVHVQDVNTAVGGRGVSGQSVNVCVSVCVCVSWDCGRKLTQNKTIVCPRPTDDLG